MLHVLDAAFFHGAFYQFMPIATQAPQAVARKFTTSLFIQGSPRASVVCVPQWWMRRSVSVWQDGQ
jgi:hypothetical protein